MSSDARPSDIAGFDSLIMAQAMPFLRLARARTGDEAREYDLSGLTQVDSSAVATLLAIVRESTETCRFLNPPDSLTKLARLYGVEDILFKP